MPATEGNQWWKLRAKSGRDKIFSSPEALWEAAQEYFEATDNRKWIKKDWVGKNADEVERETDTPYTLTGLCLFLGIDENTWYRYGKEEAYKDFWETHTSISHIMYTQKLEGAIVGAFNAGIIGKVLGLKEQSEIVSTVSVSVSQEEAKKIADALEGDV